MKGEIHSERTNPEMCRWVDTSMHAHGHTWRGRERERERGRGSKRERETERRAGRQAGGRTDRQSV